MRHPLRLLVSKPTPTLPLNPELPRLPFHGRAATRQFQSLIQRRDLRSHGRVPTAGLRTKLVGAQAHPAAHPRTYPLAAPRRPRRRPRRKARAKERRRRSVKSAGKHGVTSASGSANTTLAISRRSMIVKCIDRMVRPDVHSRSLGVGHSLLC